MLLTITTSTKHLNSILFQIYFILLRRCAVNLTHLLKTFNALYVGILEGYDTVVLTVAVPKRYAYERFGTRKEWAMYYCKRRKYAGGTVVPEYTIIKYIKERWEEYKNEFVSRVKSRLQEVVGR